MKRVWILVAMLCTVLLSPPRAWSDSVRLGAAGAQELRIPVGPRGTALSGAAIADASGVEALYWNPAGATTGEETEVLFSTMSYLLDSNVHYVGLTQPVGGRFSLGVGLKVVSLGDIPVTTEAVGGPTGESYSPSNTVIGLTLSRRLTERVAFGLTGNVVHESIRNETATGAAFDVGFQYDPSWRGVRVGAVVKSLGPKMHYSGSDFGHTLDFPDSDPSAAPRDVVTESSSFDLPATFQVGVSADGYRSEDNHLMLATAFQSNSYADNELRFGAEYDWREQFYLRAGTAASAQEDYVWGVNYGGGARASLGEWRVFVDYARQSTSDFFDDQNLVSIRIQF
jgi:hypothetical protein